MNIFILDKDPIIAAQYLCDKHVIKMALESAQLLCTTSWHFNVPAPYKKTHYNHPCSIWVRSSIDNYNWLYCHALEICNQYNIRYNKFHKSESVIKWCGELGGKPTISGLTDFVLAMPECYKCEDVVFAYRKYYMFDKFKFVSWKTRKPDWFLF